MPDRTGTRYATPQGPRSSAWHRARRIGAYTRGHDPDARIERPRPGDDAAGRQTVRAFVIEGPGRGRVREVDPPVASPAGSSWTSRGSACAARTSSCSRGEMAYLHSGEAAYPLRIGHEWCGTVSAVGPASTPPGSGGGSRATRCSAAAAAIGAGRPAAPVRGQVRGRDPERLAGRAGRAAGGAGDVPPRASRRRRRCPGAMVEPGGNAWRASRRPGRRRRAAAGARRGAIGLLVALMATARRRRRAPPGPSRAVRRGSPNRSGSSTCGPLRRCRRGRSTPSSTHRTPTDVPALAVDLVEPGPARRLDRPVGPAEPRRQPAGRVQGPHRDRGPQRVAGPARRPRPVRDQPRGSRAAGRRGRRPRRGRGRARRGTGPRLGAAPKVHVDPRR